MKDEEPIEDDRSGVHLVINAPGKSYSHAKVLINGAEIAVIDITIDDIQSDNFAVANIRVPVRRLEINSKQ